ncbi:MAG: NYN domain-containing protein [Deltaproteobacteria bacterium]|nr:NYN domain-containing protein [Deltaproteobacteria bacterium]
MSKRDNMPNINKSRLLVFVDEANVTKAASKNFNKTFDWLKFRDYLENYGSHPRDLVEMVVYVGLPPATSEWADRRESKRHYIHWLKSQGFLVYEKNGQARNGGWYKANVDVIMAIDAMDLSLRIKPDTVVLVTGDADFAHLALTIRREGIKVEVASVPQTLSTELRSSANSVIDLTNLFDTFGPYTSDDPFAMGVTPGSRVLNEYEA